MALQLADLAGEVEEFAQALGVQRPDAGPLVHSGPYDAPDTLRGYEGLVADPIKSWFAGNPDFYHRIKCDLVRKEVSRRLAGYPHALLGVLDVGCGLGKLTRHLDRHFGHVRGCDPLRHMVRGAGRNIFYMPSPMQLPFDDDSFNVAVCACVYHHIEPDRRIAHLNEIRRVLAPGGLLLIFEHNRRNPLTRLIVRRCPINSGAKLFTGGQTRRLMQQAGFERVRNRYYLFLPQVIYRAVGWVERALSFTGLGGQYYTCGVNPGPASPFLVDSTAKTL